jgi:hypothetical protein
MPLRKNKTSKKARKKIKGGDWFTGMFNYLTGKTEDKSAAIATKQNENSPENKNASVDNGENASKIVDNNNNNNNPSEIVGENNDHSKTSGGRKKRSKTCKKKRR